MFVSRYNMTTGKNEWEFVPDDYDFTQEIARSDYGDMLHDTDRNQRYYAAIKAETTKLRKAGKTIRVLDIGTGSGLLSMMAVKCGADHVTACEAFKPVAECAARVLKRNGIHDRVKIVPKRSTDLIVGVDMPERANLLVAEVFDTELIGEGALETFSHAAKNLLTDDAIVIPHAARLYTVPVHSSFLWSHNRVPQNLFGVNPNSDLSKDIARCPGTASLHDIQASALSPDRAPGLVKPLTDTPVMVKRFEFFPAEAVLKKAEIKSECDISAHGKVHAFVTWWDLLMQSDGNNVLSIAPDWVAGRPMPWRDHWIQAIYYPRNSEPLEVNVGDTLGIHFQHDEFSLAFDAFKCENGNYSNLGEPEPIPLCECGVHYNFSRQRLARLATSKYELFCSRLASTALKSARHVSCMEPPKPAVIVCISDSSVLPITCLKQDQHIQVVSVEINESSNRFVKRWRDNVSASLSERWTVTSTIEEAAEKCRRIMEATGEKSLVVLGEPYFSHATLPWYAVTFFFYAEKLQELCPDAEIQMLPMAMNMHLLLLNFDDLHKLRIPVKSCEGFDLTDFDKMIARAVSETDGDGLYNCMFEVSDKCPVSSIESHPLWEYPSTALSEPRCFARVSLESGKKLRMNNDFEDMQESEIAVETNGTVNGVAVWVTWDFNDKDLNELAPHGGLQKMSTNCNDRRYPVWDRLSRQGAYFLREPIDVKKNDRLMIDRNWGSNLGEYKLNFPRVRILHPGNIQINREDFSTDVENSDRTATK